MIARIPSSTATLLTLIFVPTALVVLLACGGAPTKGTTETGPKVAPTSTALRFVTLPANQNPAISLRFAFETGFADDPATRHGLTALAARFVAEGGTSSLDSYAFQQKLYPWAAHIGHQVDAELTVFTATIHRDQLEEFVPLFTELLSRPRFDAKDFERMRRDAIDDIEKRLRTSDDENLGKEALVELLYADHSYGHYAGGAVAALNAMTLDEVKAHAKTVFSRARLVVGLAGGYPASARATLETHLAALPEGHRRVAVPPAAVKPGAKMLIVEKDAPAVAFSLGAHVKYGRDDADFFALMVGLSAFGEHRQFHGRLMQRLREQRGLNYGDYAYGEFFEQEGWSSFPKVNLPRQEQLFSIWLRPVAPDDAIFALRLALNEYRKLLTEGLTAEEVERAKQFLDGYTRIWDKNDQRRLGNALDDLFNATPDRLTKFRAALPGLDAATVNRTLKQHLPSPEALNIVAVTANGAAFRDAILSNAPSVKKYNSEKPAALLEDDAKASTVSVGIAAERIRIVKATDLF